MRKNDEIANEVLKRVAATNEKKRKNDVRGKAAALFSAAFLMLGGVVTLSPDNFKVKAFAVRGDMGLLFKADVVGGYVLTGIVFFALGVVVTLVCIKKKEAHN